MDGATLVSSEPSLASVHWIANGAAERRETAELADLLRRTDGFLWVDIPSCDVEGQRILAEEFRFHPLAVQDCKEQSRIPKIHVYPDHVFLGLHAPEPGQNGAIHLLELDLFIGSRYVVTVHEPRDGVGLEASLRETRAVLTRIEAGRFKPSSTWELSY